jgi:hypothetical protein
VALLGPMHVVWSAAAPTRSEDSAKVFMQEDDEEI